MMPFDSSFFLLFGTTLLIVFLFFYILSAKQKKVLHYIFLTFMAELVIWSVSVMIEVQLYSVSNSSYMLFEYIGYIGACLVPVNVLLIGMYYSRSDLEFSWKSLLFFVVPIITIIIVFTNDYHHLFYISYDLPPAKLEPGPYFFVHSVYSYICMLTGLGYLCVFLLKNRSKLSPQAFLVLFGTFIPMLFNVLYTLGLPGLTIYSTPTAFSFAIILYVYAITRFNLLKVTPIALQAIVNRISDSYIFI